MDALGAEQRFQNEALGRLASSLAATRTDIEAGNRRLSEEAARASQALGERLSAVSGPLGPVAERIAEMDRTTEALASALEAGRAEIASAQSEFLEFRAKAEAASRATAAAIDHLKGQVTDGMNRLGAGLATAAEKEDVVAATERLTILGRTMGALRDQARKDGEAIQKAVKSAESVAADLRRAVDGVAGGLVEAVDRHIDERLVSRLSAMLENLEKIANRLEARGASPFKTARARILEHLLAKQTIGGKHTPWEKALETLEGPLREQGDAALKDLIRRGLVIEKPTGYGPEVSIHPQRMADVERTINGEDV